MMPQLLSASLGQAADRWPDRYAVRCGGNALTYADLADRVARFASALSARGVRPHDRVVVHCHKSLDAVVAIHGSQWAGAVAVPVDPLAPHDLMQRLAADAAPAAAVLDAQTAARLDGGIADVVWVGHGPSEAADVVSWDHVADHDPAPPTPVAPEDPAYIIYTSGSTGVPKGIVHSHRSGSTYAQLAASTYGLTDDDRLANVAPFHFDQSTFELYAAPVAGACAVLVPEVLVRFPVELTRLVAAERMTVWYSVPTILVQMLERGALDRHDTTSLRWVLFGGEVFPADHLAALMRHIPGATFSNVYGPAEVNQCTFHHLDGPPAPGSSIPIGEPWTGAEVRLVTDTGHVVSGAGTGELHVATATMMTGYWNQPDLTAAAVSSPSGDEKGWYRTGDLCERDAAGQLHFRGRVDRQIKLNGHRVELEAVEAALCEIAGVVRAAAFPVGTTGAQQLHAVVEVAGPARDGTELLHAARRRLPSYAVPAGVTLVDALPLTGSGKVDARAAERLVIESAEIPA